MNYRCFGTSGGDMHFNIDERTVCVCIYCGIEKREGESLEIYIKNLWIVMPLPPIATLVTGYIT